METAGINWLKIASPHTIYINILSGAKLRFYTDDKIIAAVQSGHFLSFTVINLKIIPNVYKKIFKLTL